MVGANGLAFRRGQDVHPTGAGGTYSASPVPSSATETSFPPEASQGPDVNHSRPPAYARSRGSENGAVSMAPRLLGRTSETSKRSILPPSERATYRVWSTIAIPAAPGRSASVRASVPLGRSAATAPPTGSETNTRAGPATTA